MRKPRAYWWQETDDRREEIPAGFSVPAKEWFDRIRAHVAAQPEPAQNQDTDANRLKN